MVVRLIVVVVAGSVVVVLNEMVSSRMVVVVPWENGVKNGRSTTVVMVMKMVAVMVGPIVVSGSAMRGSLYGKVTNGTVDDGSMVVPVGTVVDVVVAAVVLVVVAGSDVEEVVWARPDRAGANAHSASVSATRPRRYSAVVLMTVTGYRGVRCSGSDQPVSASGRGCWAGGRGCCAGASFTFTSKKVTDEPCDHRLATTSHDLPTGKSARMAEGLVAARTV